MSLCLTPRIESIAQAVTGRPVSLFAADCQAQAGALGAAIRGRRVLVAGGAGSIGSATIMELLRLEPAALAVIDPSENNLAELVRTIRAQPRPFPGELLIEPLDYGSALAARWLATQRPFDLVLSFAALKHVRSERDAFSVLRMLEVNLLKADRFLRTLRVQGHGVGGVFFVSTDKAANPVSLMGASKRVMELLLWAHADPAAPAGLVAGGTAPALPRITATRFANVAFSDGSLPWGFLQRLEKHQPLAAPGDIRRYLVSPTEAGQLCLLAAGVCPHRHVAIPRLDPVRDLVSFTDIATATLKSFGLETARYDDADAARTAVPGDLVRGRYPLLVTRSDTSGEKETEEFIARGEQASDVGLASVAAIAAPTAAIAPLQTMLHDLERAVAGELRLDKESLVGILAGLVPELMHRETGTSLDGKM